MATIDYDGVTQCIKENENYFGKNPKNKSALKVVENAKKNKTKVTPIDILNQLENSLIKRADVNFVSKVRPELRRLLGLKGRAGKPSENAKNTSLKDSKSANTEKKEILKTSKSANAGNETKRVEELEKPEQVWTTSEETWTKNLDSNLANLLDALRKHCGPYKREIEGEMTYDEYAELGKIALLFEKVHGVLTLAVNGLKDLTIKNTENTKEYLENVAYPFKDFVDGAKAGRDKPDDIRNGLKLISQTCSTNKPADDDPLLVSLRVIPDKIEDIGKIVGSPTFKKRVLGLFDLAKDIHGEDKFNRPDPTMKAVKINSRNPLASK